MSTRDSSLCVARPRVLCPACRSDPDAGIGRTTAKHTSPPNGSDTCECGSRTCACYGVQVRAGVRQENAPTIRDVP